MVLAALNEASIPWRGVRGVNLARSASGGEGWAWRNGPSGGNDEPRSACAGSIRGTPSLPDTEYLLCHNAASNNELAKVVFEAMENYHNPWQYAAVTPEGGMTP